MLTFLISIIVLYFILIGICIGYKYYLHYYTPIEYTSIEHMAVFTGDSSLNVKQFSSQLSILDPIIRDKLFFKQDAEPYNVSTLSSEELHIQEYTSNQEEKKQTEDTKELELKSLQLTSFTSSSDKNRLNRPKNKRYPQLNLKNILQTDSVLEEAKKQTPNAYKRIPVINKKVPTGSKVVNLVLNEPISDYHHSRGFRENFISDMSKLTNVPAERYQIVGVSKGSIEVKFIIIELDDGKSLKVKVEGDGKSENQSSDKIADLLSVKYTQLVEFKQKREEVKLIKLVLKEKEKAAIEKGGDGLKKALQEIQKSLAEIESSKTPEEKKIEESMKLILDSFSVLDKVSVKSEDMPQVVHEVTKDEPLTLIDIILQVVEVIVSQKIKSVGKSTDLGVTLTLQPPVPIQNEQQRKKIKEKNNIINELVKSTKAPVTTSAQQDPYGNNGSVFTIFPKHRDTIHILGKEYAA